MERNGAHWCFRRESERETWRETAHIGAIEEKASERHGEKRRTLVL